MVRVRYGWGQARINGTLLQGTLNVSQVLIRVNDVVKGGKVFRIQSKRLFIKGQRRISTSLTVCERRGLSSQTALDPKPGILWICMQRFVYGPLIGRRGLYATVFKVINFSLADFEPCALLGALMRDHVLRPTAAFTGGNTVLQTDVGIGQLNIGHSEIRILA